MRRGYHKNDLLFLIDFIEESPGPDSISPCFGSEVFEVFDIWAKMGMLTQLRINEFAKLMGDFATAGLGNVFQVFLELLGFEYAIFIQ